MGYAFISYSTKNQAEADAMRAFLNKNQIETWMAPGDIPAGQRYAAVIAQAVRDCACVVLMLTDAAQNSVWVTKEIERAVNYRKPIIPVQLEDVTLNDEFEFYISTDQLVAVHKVDEQTPEIQKVLASAKAMVGIGSVPPSEPVAPPTPTQQDTPVIEMQPPTATPQEPATLQTAEELYKKAKSLYDQGDYQSAAPYLTQAADLGYAAAQYTLGDCHYYGHVVTQDRTRALWWYRKAAEQGYMVAQNDLGYCYFHGYGAAVDVAQAVYWFRKAAEQGHATAQNWLGYCYQNGRGVTPDIAQALSWYCKAADQGNATAQLNLGDCYCYGQGVTQSYNQAVIWYRKAADQGRAEAQNNLGYCYQHGLGVTKDVAQAAAWYRKAAAQGHAGAKNSLAELT